MHMYQSLSRVNDTSNESLSLGLTLTKKYLAAFENDAENQQIFEHIFQISDNEPSLKLSWLNPGFPEHAASRQIESIASYLHAGRRFITSLISLVTITPSRR